MQNYLSQNASSLRRKALLAALGDEDASDVRSNGGVGAGAFLFPRPASSTAKTMPDSHSMLVLRDRLLMPVCPVASTCHHRRPDGRLCGEPLDSRGKHARKCKIQGLVDRRHGLFRDWGAETWSRCIGVPTTTEQRVAQWDRLCPETGEVEQAKLDFASSDPTTGEALFFDTVIYTAHSIDASRQRALARHDGKAAADAAAEKRRRYSEAGASLVPLPLEAGGRPGEDLVDFVRRCGTAAAADEGPAAFSRLWHECSCLLQLANAELILSAVGS